MSTLIALDAGHGQNTLGKRCLKTIDPNQTREWHLNNRIADKLEQMLAGYHCRVLRVDDTTGTKDISLSARVRAANTAHADIYISIHHNAGIGGRVGGGTVVYYSSASSKRLVQARNLYNSIVKSTGLRGNRSSAVLKRGFYVIKHTRMPAFLIENGFMDSLTDTPIILTDAHAEKTAQGILNFLISEYSLIKNSNFSSAPEPAAPPADKPTVKYIKNGIDYSLVFDPVYYSAAYPDLKTAFGADTSRLFEHFYTYGMKEGRQASSTFNVTAYKNRYSDLQNAFGSHLPSYYSHYIQYGIHENRISV